MGVAADIASRLRELARADPELLSELELPQSWNSITDHPHSYTATLPADLRRELTQLLASQVLYDRLEATAPSVFADLTTYSANTWARALYHFVYRALRRLPFFCILRRCMLHANELTASAPWACLSHTLGGFAAFVENSITFSDCDINVCRQWSKIFTAACKLNDLTTAGYLAEVYPPRYGAFRARQVRRTFLLETSIRSLRPD